nr:FAD-binding oxidoreductase [Candidatus Sigynarchaeota archaeon]
MNQVEDIVAIKAHIASIVGNGNVSVDPLVLCSYSEDASPFDGKSPALVARPENAEEVSLIMKCAAKNKTPIVPVGGRSSICGAPIPRVDNAIMIDFTRMDKILSIDDDAMTVRVQSGITWSRLIHELKEKGFKLGFRGPYGGNAGTVGGSLSANSIGCGASAHGGACDNVTNIEVVLANGDTVRTGSAWKDANPGIKSAFARYCTFNDITGIFLGDHGSLGLKVAATLKIFPLAKGVSYFDMGFPDAQSGVKAFHEIQKNHLAEEIVMLGDVNSIELLASSYRSTFPDVNCIFGIIIEEADEKIADIKKDLCEKIARKYGGKPIGTFLSKAHWLNMFNLVQSLFEEGFWYNTCHIRPISTLPALIDRFHEIAKKHELKKHNINWILSALGVDHCFTSGWITLFLKDKAKKPILETAWKELKEYEIEANGVPYWTGKLWEPYALPVANETFLDVMRKVKQALDPDNLIHPQTFMV